MIRIRNVKYHHLETPGIKEYDDCLRQIIRGSDFYSAEPDYKNPVSFYEEKILNDIVNKSVSKAKNLKYPVSVLHDEGVKLGVPLFFLERKIVSKEFDFYQDRCYSDTANLVKEVYEKIISIDDFKAELEKTSKKETDYVLLRDNNMALESEFIENKIRLFFNDFHLPEKITYSVFTGACHNFMKFAYPRLKDNKNIEFCVFIPEVGAEDQEMLYINIILSHAIQNNLSDIPTFNHYAALGDGSYNFKWNKTAKSGHKPYYREPPKNFKELQKRGMDGMGTDMLKSRFNFFFKDTLNTLDDIKSKDIPFEQFDDILQEINLTNFKDVVLPVKNLFFDSVKRHKGF